MEFGRLFSVIYNQLDMSSEPDNKTGNRLVCTRCGAEFVVTRGGDGAVTCCDERLEVRR